MNITREFRRLVFFMDDNIHGYTILETMCDFFDNQKGDCIFRQEGVPINKINIVKEVIKDMYQFLQGNYFPGDEIYVFGAGTGAMLARIFCAFIKWADIPHPQDLVFRTIRRLIDDFFNNKSPNHSKDFYDDITISFIGLLDTISTPELQQFDLPYTEGFHKRCCHLRSSNSLKFTDMKNNVDKFEMTFIGNHEDMIIESDDRQEVRMSSILLRIMMNCSGLEFYPMNINPMPTKEQVLNSVVQKEYTELTHIVYVDDSGDICVEEK